MNFNSSDSSNLAARRARVKELQAQGRVFNSSMRAKAIREAKLMGKIEDLADNIIAGLQSNPNVKREVVKVKPIEYIDTTEFDIVNLGSADKDSYSNHRRAEYSNTKKLENAADAILKELQSDSDDNNDIDEDEMDSILNSIREEDDENNYTDEDEIVENNNSETDEDDNIDEDEMDSILNMIRNDDADNYTDENDEDNNDIDEDETDDNNDIDEDEMDSILNSIREEDEDNNNSEDDEETGYYEYSELQERIVNYIVKNGSYDMKKDEYQKYFNEIQPLIEMNIVDKLIGEGGDMITLFEY